MKRREFKRFDIFHALIFVVLINCASAALAKKERSFTVPVMPDIDRQGQSQLVNNFILNSNARETTDSSSNAQTAEVKVYAHLLTALNSNFNLPGDSVEAVVDGTPGSSSLPPGTILEGMVENTCKNARLHQDGQLFVRFYRAVYANRAVDVDFLICTQDGAVRPGDRINFHPPMSRKQKVRLLLTSAGRVAVPLAVGSGGLSLAITAGTGAILGALLADDHRYLSGTIRGAWEGAGLTFLDPFVCKGATVQLRSNTPLVLHSQVPFDLAGLTTAATAVQQPLPCISIQSILPDKQAVSLTTHAQLVNQANSGIEKSANNFSNQDDIDNSAHVDRCIIDPLSRTRMYIEQKNLAAALKAVNDAYAEFPDNAEVRKLHDQILPFVTGRHIEDNSHDVTTQRQAPL